MTTILIIEHRDPTPEQRAAQAARAAACVERGLTVWRVPDLYHLPEDSPLWARLAALRGPVLAFSWLYPRPAAWLLRRHGVGADGVRAAAMDDDTALDGLAGDTGALAPLDAPVGERWYPVMDGDRCTQCHHCLQFCLFGVYDLDGEGRVTVANPDACKPGCPACSRICPQGAIIFPLFAREPAVAGAPGQIMAPDPAARRMYYTRTKRPCPLCGATTAHPGDGPLCPECGRPTAPAPGSEALDDLIDRLDALAQKDR
jgi:NAD-dependent dihydropyrimidine dehydrogenase PreA subunit